MHRSKPETLHYGCLNATPHNLLACWSNKGLCALYPIMKSLEASLEEIQTQFRSSHLVPTETMPGWMVNVENALLNPAHPFTGPYDLRGTEFQQAVWQALLTIPAGQTRSYREIAEQIGRPKAVRAVGSACGANPISVLIPCHRVIRSDGSYQGYHWGVEMKTRLLNQEAGLDLS